MNIMFLLRYDYNRKHGGDLIQAKWYESELTKYKNCHVHYADHIDTNNSAKKKIYYSLVFLFNISMIYEHLFYLKKIKYGKVIIVPIMQPNSNNLSSKNKLKYIYRSIMNWKYPIIPSNNNARELIDSAKYFIFLSEKEKVGFGSEYGFQEKNSVIIHNMSTINPIKGRRIKFLILGRIEKLKNTIEMELSILNF